jgi:hypothetical protein
MFTKPVSKIFIALLILAVVFVTAGFIASPVPASMVERSYNGAEQARALRSAVSSYDVIEQVRMGRTSNTSIDNLLTVSGKDAFRDYKGYSAWERNILWKLYDKGGPNAIHGVMYILQNNIHITVGDSFTYDIRGAHGDWRSLGDNTGWYDRHSNSIALNPNFGYQSGEVPDTWGLAVIIHEAKHLEQGSPLTKYKELEATQIGIEVAINLGGRYGPPGRQPGASSRDGLILALPLSHDIQVINEYSEILQNDPGTYWYWFFYRFLPIDSPCSAP